MFIDGILATTTTVDAVPWFNANQYAWLSVGAMPSLNSESVYPKNAFQGVIEDLRIYNRVLSAQEVADLHTIESTPPFSPALSIQVKSVRVNMGLQPGVRYQLETSPDLGTWTAYGVPFVAISATMFQDFDILDGRQYFRINEVP